MQPFMCWFFIWRALDPLGLCFLMSLDWCAACVRLVLCCGMHARMCAAQTIGVWDMRSRSQCASLRGHSSWVSCIQLGPRAHTGGGRAGVGGWQRDVVSGSWDNTIKLWRLVGAAGSGSGHATFEDVGISDAGTVRVALSSLPVNFTA
jgi:hypothetical protein